MRVAWKFSLGITLGIGLVLAAQGLLYVQHLAEVHEGERRLDELILCSTLAVAVEDLWANSGRERAEAFIERASDHWPGSKFAVLMESDLPAGESLPEGASVQEVRRDGRAWMRAVAPIVVRGETVALVELQHAHESDVTVTDTALRQQIIVTGLGVLLAGLISLFLGMRILGRPLRDLTILAQHVAEGDYSKRAPERRNDEIGRLAHAFNEMSAKLESTRERVSVERRARTEALEELRHADRLTLVGRLASSIAHELGTPLNVVSGRAMMIAMDEELSEDARENGTIIGQQSQHMAGLISDLLQLSRKNALVRTHIDVFEVVNSAVALLAPICDDKRVRVAVMGKEDLHAFAHRGKILQVLTNLMMNALQAMPQGGKLTITMSREELDDPKDRHASAGAYARIAISDEGVGIDPDTVSRIFEPFFTTKGDGEGTGLGLAVCHGIIREHGGFLEVTSEVGQGTTFYVYLPKSEEA